MKLAVVGVGSAGSRIVNRILAYEKTSDRDLCNGNTLLVNSTPPAFDTTELVPEERRLRIGDVYWEVDSTDIEGDPDVAAEVALEERNELNRAFDLIEFHQVDGILVIAGLAGGTGGGVGAVVIDQLKEICDEPVYAVGLLPEESEGQQPALNAARALRSFVETADNVIAFDNETWRADDSPCVGALDATDREDATGETDPIDEVATDETYERLNRRLAERLVTLFAAGEFGGTSASENRMDPSDIIRTLDTGGISSIGYTSIDLPRTGGISTWLRELRDRLTWLPDHEIPWLPDQELDDEDESTDATKINRLVRRAARSKLTLPCELSSADRALIALSGPSEVLSRKGFESGRYWLEKEADVVDVMAGDEPHDRSSALTAVVLFSNVTEVPRIERMQRMAVDHQHSPTTEGTNYGRANPR